MTKRHKIIIISAVVGVVIAYLVAGFFMDYNAFICAMYGGDYGEQKISREMLSDIGPSNIPLIDPQLGPSCQDPFIDLSRIF